MKQDISEEKPSTNRPSTSEDDRTSPYEPSSDTGSPTLAPTAGRNLLLGEIGRGGMGAVFQGRDTHLERDLAVKVLLDEHRHRPALVRRFLEEARIAGQLQHPGVAPVYELGHFEDERPYFTMKLVKGHTLAELLRQRTEPRQDLGRFLGIFGQVCQTVAYAHSQGVIHRDLKPANVMVGSFGEVQVMDWGLAKTLRERPPAVERSEPSGDPSAPSGLTDEGSQTSVVGTPAYMPPEQSSGEPADERADVFGLGAVLCEVLTGRPPYSGTRETLYEKARKADLGEAFARLDGCGAEPELIALARRCLAARVDDRPRHAGEVAQAVTAHLAGVEERRHQAEQERAAAQARAEEAKMTVAAERRARRLTLVLAGAALLLTVGGGLTAWNIQQQHAHETARRHEAQLRARDRLDRGWAMLETGWQGNDPGQLAEAQTNAEQAAELVEATESIREETQRLHKMAQQRHAAAVKNRALLAALLDVHDPGEVTVYRKSHEGVMVPVPRPDLNEQYAAAFGRWGVDLAKMSIEESAARLGEQPALVVQELVAGLDEWGLERRLTGRAEDDWRKPFLLADRLDAQPRRREVRQLILTTPAADQEAVRAELQRLSTKVNVTAESPLSVLALARVLVAFGDRAAAVALLRKVVAIHRDQPMLLYALGKLLVDQKPPRLDEAIGCYRAACAARRPLGVSLALTLFQAGRAAEGELVLRDLVAQQPDNPELHFHLGDMFTQQGRLTDAVAAYRRVTELSPTEARAFNNLGVNLRHLKRLDESVAALRRATELEPEMASAFTNLGASLQQQNKPVEAEAAQRRAIELQPRLIEAHANLSLALKDQKKWSDALAAADRAIALNPNFSLAHNSRGSVLMAQNRSAEAAVSFRRAIELDPQDAIVYHNLGSALGRQQKFDDAVVQYRKAIQLDPDIAEAHYNLGYIFQTQEKFDDAISAYRKAIEIEPDLSKAQNNLGNVLADLGRQDEAEKSFRRAIQSDSGNVAAYNSLGTVLTEQGKFEEADAVLSKALALRPTMAEAHFNLGILRRKQKKLDEAVAALRRAAELNRRHPVIREELRITRRWQELSDALPRFLVDQPPTAAEELLELAVFCTGYKGFHRAAADFYAAAFSADPKLADDLSQDHRYNAACSAALAAAGRGEDASRLQAPDRARLRQQAQRWLHADLAHWSKLAESKKAADRQTASQKMQHWLADADLAGVREPAALAQMSEGERAAWSAFWQEVQATSRKTSRQP